MESRDLISVEKLREIEKDYLEKFVEESKSRGCYVAMYKGDMMKFPSGKSSWGSLSAAKNALRVAVGNSIRTEGGQRLNSAVVCGFLESKLLVTYKKLK